MWLKLVSNRNVVPIISSCVPQRYTTPISLIKNIFVNFFQQSIIAQNFYLQRIRYAIQLFRNLIKNSLATGLSCSIPTWSFSQTSMLKTNRRCKIQLMESIYIFAFNCNCKSSSLLGATTTIRFSSTEIKR